MTAAHVPIPLRDDLRAAFQKAGFATVAISLLALIAFSSMIAGFRQTLGFFQSLPLQIIVAYVAMFLFVAIPAPRVASWCAGQPALTGLYFVVVFMIGVIAGTITSMFVWPNWGADPPAKRLHDYVVKPTLALWVLGALPAYFVGGAGGCFFKYFQTRER